MRFGRQVATAALGASLVFGGVAAGVASLATPARAQNASAEASAEAAATEDTTVQDTTTQDASTEAVMTGDTATVDVDFLNVRQTPSLSGTILRTLAYGTVVQVVTGPVIADGYNWYRLQQNGAFIGWSVAGFLMETGGGSTPGGEFTFGQTVTVDTDLLNVRSAPSISASVVTVYAFGTAAEITGGPTTADGYTWYAVDNIGWVASEFIIAGSAGENPGNPGNPTGQFEVGDEVVVDADVVNIRSGAGTNNPVKYTASYGDTFSIKEGPVAANGYEWYRVSDLVGAWIAGDFLLLADEYNPGNPGGGTGNDSFTYGQTVTVSTDLLNVRSLPTLSGSVLSVYASGQTATITGGPTTADGITWYAVDNLGWVAGQYLAG